MFSAPTRRPAPSTTGSALTARCCMRFTASAASISGVAVTQSRVITSPIRIRFMSTSFSSNPILPVAGYSRISDGLGEYIRHLILPAVSLGLVVIALIARMTRASVLEVLKEDYVRTARAKGITERAILIRHALRNASLPILTVVGLSLAGLLSGAVVTESVFAIPGLGRLAVEAIATRDYPIIQAMIILIGGFYVFINLIVDILYAFLDPRIRY